MGLPNLILTFFLFIWIPIQVGSGDTSARKCKEKEFTSLVYINSKIGPICSGTILRQLHIVTAAHCVEDRGIHKSLRIVAGVIELGTTSHNSRQLSSIKKVVIHPKYDPETVKNDIAILILNEAVRFCSHADEAYIASKSPKVNDIGLVAGWSLGNKWTKFCLSSKVTVLEKNECEMDMTRHLDDQNETLNAENLRTPDTSQICAGKPTAQTGPYLGDPGGPLYIKDSDDLRLAGILSYAKSEDSSKAVYTDIAYHNEWITKELEKLTDDNVKRESERESRRRQEKNGANQWKKFNKIKNFMLSILTLRIKAAVSLAF